MTTEINLATADRHQMKYYAKEELGLSLSLSMTETTMREKIAAHCKENGLDAPVAEIGVTKGNKQHRANWPTIVIPKQEKKGGDEPVFVGLQGVGYLIPRAIECRVPPGVVGILKNAKQDIITQDDATGELHTSQVYTYPFQVVHPGVAA